MTLYRTMDLVKNGIAISYLFFLVLSLFPPEPRLSSWWFNYHVQYYGILCAIPCLVFCLLQFIEGYVWKRGEKRKRKSHSQGKSVLLCQQPQQRRYFWCF